MRRLIIFLFVFLLVIGAQAKTHHVKKAVSHAKKTTAHKQEPQAKTDANAKVKIAVTIAPQKYIIMKIAHSRIDVVVMVPPGSSPHSYEPKPKQMTDLANAAAYLTIGDPAERNWLDKFKSVNRDMKIVPIDTGIDKIDMDDKEKQENNDPNGKDPHVWLDPVLMMTLAKNTAEALIEADPANKLYYQTNLAIFERQLENLDKNMSRMFKNLKNRKFMVFHPSWGYFAKRYNLEQISVEVDGKSPKPAELVQLIKTAKDNDMKLIFAQPQFSQKEVSTIAKETGARVAIMDPLSDNWAENLMKAAMLITDN